MIPATASSSQYRERERVAVDTAPWCRDGDSPAADNRQWNILTAPRVWPPVR